MLPEPDGAFSHMPAGSSRRDGSKVCTVEDISIPSNTRVEHVVVDDAPREIIGNEALPPNESMLPMQLRFVVVEESSAAVMRSNIGGFDTDGECLINAGSYEFARLCSVLNALLAWRAAGT